MKIITCAFAILALTLLASCATQESEGYPCNEVEYPYCENDSQDNTNDYRSTDDPLPEEPQTSNNSDMITIDNTPADIYVDIEAGANNPANALPWITVGGRLFCDCCLGEVISTRFYEINILEDGLAGYSWEEFLQVEPPCLSISSEESYESLPHRRIQCRYGARIVANDILGQRSDAQRFRLGAVEHDPQLNLWVFTYFIVPLVPSWSPSYLVNGYNGQIIRTWAS